MANHRSERLLRNDFGQYDVFGRVGELEALGVQLRDVGGEDIAAAGFIGLDGFVRGSERNHLVLHIVALEVVGEILLGRGPGLYADRRAVQFQRRIHLQRLLHQKALAVIIGDAGEIGAERSIARQRPGGVAGEHVDLAGLQRGEAVLGRKRHEFDLACVVEDGGGNRPADIDVEPGPVTLVVGGREPRQALAYAAGELASVLDRLEGLRRGGLGRETGGQSEGNNQRYAFHGLGLSRGRATIVF